MAVNFFANINESTDFQKFEIKEERKKTFHSGNDFRSYK